MASRTDIFRFRTSLFVALAAVGCAAEAVDTGKHGALGSTGATTTTGTSGTTTDATSATTAGPATTTGAGGSTDAGESMGTGGTGGTGTDTCGLDPMNVISDFELGTAKEN